MRSPHSRRVTLSLHLPVDEARVIRERPRRLIRSVTTKSPLPPRHLEAEATRPRAGAIKRTPLEIPRGGERTWPSTASSPCPSAGKAAAARPEQLRSSDDVGMDLGQHVKTADEASSARLIG